MNDKVFKLDRSAIKPLATGLGSCIASDRITVDGRPIGYMYREEPTNDTDSGWRFFAGDESPAYADDARNFALYDVNTIANYDLDIIPFLRSPPCSAFARDETGRLASAPFEPSDD